MGRGVLGGPRAIEIAEIDPAAGRLEVRLSGAMAEAFPNEGRKAKAGRIDAWCRRHGKYVVTLCLLKDEEHPRITQIKRGEVEGG